MTEVPSTMPPGAGNTPERPSKSGRRRPVRTCVGCGKTDAPEALVRLVASPEGEVAADLAGGQFGRGAHVHPAQACLAAAPKGLSRSLRTNIRMTGSELVAAVVAASERRVWGLLASAIRARHAAVGGESVTDAAAAGRVELVVVARDAAASASLTPVREATARGDAVAFGTKTGLGALVGKSEVGVLAITSAPLAAAVRDAVRVGEQASHQVRGAENR